MKNHSFQCTLLLIISPLCCLLAQIRMVGLPDSTVYWDKMNPIQFKNGSDSLLDCSTWKIETSNCTCTRKADGSFVLTTYKPSKSGFLRIRDQRGRELGFFPLKMRPAPEPRLFLVSQNGLIPSDVEKVSKNWMAGIDSVLLVFPIKRLGQCDIQSFEVDVVLRNEEPYIVKNKGAVFSAELKNIFAKARPGDIFYLNEFRYDCHFTRSDCWPLSFAIVFKVE